MHKSHTHDGIQTSEKGDNTRILIIGISLGAALILLFLISTVFKSNGSNAEPSEVAQVLPLEDSLPDIEVESFDEEIPEFWLQARALSTGKAGWGPDIVAPFDTLWHMRSNAGREFFSSPALVDGVLYFGCNDGILRAVDAADGSVEWTYVTACGICGEPSVDSSSVYSGGQDGVIYALDRFSGTKRWSAGLGYHVFAGTAVLCDTLVVTGNSMGKVCALNTATGEPVWDDEIGGIVLGPAVIDSMVVFSSEGGDIAAFDHEGNRIWFRDYSSQASAPSADETGVYAGFSNGVVRKFSLADGEVIWETDIAGTSRRCVLARPVVAGDIILSGTYDGQMVSLSSSDGSVLWRQQFDNWLQLPPAVGQELLYVACDDQRLHIVDLATGAKIDSLEMDGYSGTAPLLVNGKLYFGNTSGDFTALSGTVPEADTLEVIEDVSDTAIEETPTEIPEETPEETIEESFNETLEEQPEVEEQPLVEEQPDVEEPRIVEDIPGEMIQALPAQEQSGSSTEETE